ncbi:Ger(x)C family spore germination protein [Brevibacillus dissolubilis]|uniref:Ger(x)C family spore germination protein n=1 Tax=Brevibacillus dissolubilis TaxID=1844116 RepID=UPI0011164C6F|nr:hypothetical protein [Brevibacillus dissolubilis]
MTSKRFRPVFTLLILWMILLITGCWNRREIEDLAFVLATGIDKSSQGYLLNVQVANVPALSKDGNNAPTFFTYTSAGQTVFDAVRKTTHTSPNRLFWAHTKVLVINEKAAQSGIKPYLEFFSRDAEERRNFLLVVSPHKTIDILKADIKTEIIPALALANILEGYRSTSTSVKLNLNEFFRIYHGSQSAQFSRCYGLDTGLMSFNWCQVCNLALSIHPVTVSIVNRLELTKRHDPAVPSFGNRL